MLRDTMTTFADYRAHVLSHAPTVVIDRYRELFDVDTQGLDTCIEQDYYGTGPEDWAFLYTMTAYPYELCGRRIGTEHDRGVKAWMDEQVGGNK